MARWWSIPENTAYRYPRCIARRSVSPERRVFVQPRGLLEQQHLAGPGIKRTVAVIDTSRVINTFLQKTRGVSFFAFDPAQADPDRIIIGAHDFRAVTAPWRGFPTAGAKCS